MANPVTKAVQRAVRILTDKSPWGSMTSPWAIPTNYNTRDYLKAYGEIGWLFGCVSRIGQAIGEAEPRLYVERVARDGRKEREEIHNHVLLDLLDYCNPFKTGYDFMMLTQFYLDLVGNSFWYVVNNRLGVPGELWNIPPAFMHPVPDPKEFISGWVFRVGTEEIPFERDEIIHLSYPNPDNPYWGLGPAQSIAVDLQTESFASRWNRNYFYNDAAVGTTIIYPEEISTDEYDRIKEQWRARHQGLGRAHKVAILSGGAKIEKAVISQRDMDFWKLRKLNRDNILGAFGMPLSVMGVSENVNRANAESGEYVFARWTIRPRLRLLAAKLTEGLARRYDPKLKLEFTDPVPKDREKIRKEIEGGLNAGYITINEARQEMGMSPIDGGDIILLPSNKVPVRIDNNRFPEELPAPVPKFFSGNGHRQLETVEQKEAHWRQWADKALKWEKDLTKNLREMFADQLKEALANLSESGGKDQTLIDKKKARQAYKDAATDILTKLVTQSYEDAVDLKPPPQGDKAQVADRGVEQRLARLGHNQEVRGSNPLSATKYLRLVTRQDDAPEPFKEAMKWLKTRIGWAADEVGDETAALLASELADGYAEGEGMKELSKRVQKVFDHCDKVRASRIARTETIMASNEGALRGYEATGVSRAEFYAALDERTCPTCMDLHEMRRDLKDSHGIIPVHPNCRCTWLPVTD